jgi:hypothetical protein
MGLGLGNEVPAFMDLKATILCAYLESVTETEPSQFSILPKKRIDPGPIDLRENQHERLFPTRSFETGLSAQARMLTGAPGVWSYLIYVIFKQT